MRPILKGIVPSLGILLLGWIVSGCDRSGSMQRAADGKRSVEEEWFRDVTVESGVRFSHVTGTNYHMPDQVGLGVATFDYDRDGRLDLYFVQNAGVGSGVRNELYRQREDGRFENVTMGSGLGVEGRGMSVACGDVNNDGWPDVVITEDGAVRVFWNRGKGRFEEIAGESSGVVNPRWAVPVSFLDFDRDGWLDVVVGNYLDYDPTQECLDAQGRHDFCAPSGFPGTSARLWRNRTERAGEEPRFEEVTGRAGLGRVLGAAMGIVCADFTGDDWVDIFLADDGRANRLLVNRGDGTFVDEAMIRGVAYNAMGKTAANMGLAWGDLDGDGRSDLFVTHLAEEFHGLFVQDRVGFYSDRVGTVGLQAQGWRGTGFGAVAADFDLDGDLDLGWVNGLVRRAGVGQTPVMTGVNPWWGRYAQRAQLFMNGGGGRFEDVSGLNPTFCGESMVGRSLVVGDLDRDGRLDLVTGGVGGPARIYRNRRVVGGVHWLELRLVEPRFGGRDAIGAEAVVVCGGRRHWRLVQPSTSYASSHDAVLHFGLGAAGTVDSVEVKWADGVRETFGVSGVDRLEELRRGEGR